MSRPSRAAHAVLLRAVGAAYVVCWIAALIVGGPDLEPGASAADVRGAFASSAAVWFAVLAHGLAGALLIPLGALLVVGRGRIVATMGGIVAASLSFVQLAGELALVFVPGSVDAVAAWEAITRVDGVKMFVLAAVVLVTAAHDQGRPVVRGVLSAVTALALSISAMGYVLASSALMPAAFASLPLLLVWVLVYSWRTPGADEPAQQDRRAARDRARAAQPQP